MRSSVCVAIIEKVANFQLAIFNLVSFAFFEAQKAV